MYAPIGALVLFVSLSKKGSKAKKPSMLYREVTLPRSNICKLASLLNIYISANGVTEIEQEYNRVGENFDCKDTKS